MTSYVYAAILITATLILGMKIYLLVANTAVVIISPRKRPHDILNWRVGLGNRDDLWYNLLYR